MRKYINLFILQVLYAQKNELSLQAKLAVLYTYNYINLSDMEVESRIFVQIKDSNNSIAFFVCLLTTYIKLSRYCTSRCLSSISTPSTPPLARTASCTSVPYTGSPPGRRSTTLDQLISSQILDRGIGLWEGWPYCVILNNHIHVLILLL